ncbi:VPA1262 family N-terminal domain-containing protein [Bradyrhizobium sp. Ai1a-2]|uniref:VPA1262 family N-terminal domain-containing protein n=1 Tax=Bradyrhizobium sp. Ai1a-2 TaxID=196490 RepID=UPI00041A9BC8|nr:VPA1262 family N-terminal domain-containing protein [Bradyrhizobium sp. Ai1a-2]
MDNPDDSVSAENIAACSSSKLASRWPNVTTDYHGALIRLVTMRAGGKQYLLFGYVELFPRDIPVPKRFAAGQKPWTVPNIGGDVTLAASALPMATADALAWYEEAARGCVIIPQAAPTVEINAPPFGVEPALGRFCVGEPVPFSAQWHGGPRIHRLVPMEDPTEAVLRLRSSSAAREWLAENAGFDPFEREEWVASLSLVAPDPLLSGVAHFTRDRKAGGSEQLVFQAHRRHYNNYPDADAEALQLVMLQRRPAGWTEILPTSFDRDGFALKDFAEPVSETGFAIVCPSRGLIRMIPPTHWMEQINIGLGLVNKVFDVEVPAGGRRKPASRYKTGRMTDAGSVQVGEALPRSGAIRVVELQEVRKGRIARQSAPQQLFGVHEANKDELTGDDLARMRREAESYVAGLVSHATRRVVFVDPDFGVRELQNYALRVTRDGVDVTVLTGAPHLRNVRSEDAAEGSCADQKTASSVPPGVQMLGQLRHIESRLGPSAPNVFVMPGSKKPLFHDRFLVTDDTVWASGPSFNELGERIGLISRVHEPSVVIAAIERALSQSKPLADWIVETGFSEPQRG